MSNPDEQVKAVLANSVNLQQVLGALQPLKQGVTRNPKIAFRPKTKQFSPMSRMLNLEIEDLDGSHF